MFLDVHTAFIASASLGSASTGFYYACTCKQELLLLDSRCQDARVGGAKSEFHGLDPNRPWAKIVSETVHQLHHIVCYPIYPPYPTGVDTLEACEATWLRRCSASHSICTADLVHASGMLLSKLGGDTATISHTPSSGLCVSGGFRHFHVQNVVATIIKDVDGWRS